MLYCDSVITVYDWDGNFVTLIRLNIGIETENISIVDDVIYVGCGDGGYGVVYEIYDIKPKE